MKILFFLILSAIFNFIRTGILSKFKILLDLNFVKIANLSFSDTTDELFSDDKNVKEDLEMIKRIKSNYKHFACLATIRNSLNYGNNKIREVLKKTVHNKSDTFDKILILMLKTCEKIINKKQISEVK